MIATNNPAFKIWLLSLRLGINNMLARQLNNIYKAISISIAPDIPSLNTILPHADNIIVMINAKRSFIRILISIGATAAGIINAIPLILVSRSEEHTSELQSRENLVCRLL